MRGKIWCLSVGLLSLVSACAKVNAQPSAGIISVASREIVANGRLAVDQTGDGKDLSPSLRWSAPAHQCASFAVVCEDPDAPRGGWVHWLVWNIPANTLQLPANLSKTAQPGGTLVQGMNDFNKVGYNGPLPPPGKLHHYRFRVLALSKSLNLAADSRKADFYRAVRGLIVAQGMVVGTYWR